MIRICNTLSLCTYLHKNKTFLLKFILIIIVVQSGGIIARIRILCIRSLYKRRMLCFSVAGAEGERGAVVDVVAGVVAVAGAVVDVAAGAASSNILFSAGAFPY